MLACALLILASSSQTSPQKDNVLRFKDKEGNYQQYRIVLETTTQLNVPNQPLRSAHQEMMETLEVKKELGDGKSLVRDTVKFADPSQDIHHLGGTNFVVFDARGSIHAIGESLNSLVSMPDHFDCSLLPAGPISAGQVWDSNFEFPTLGLRKTKSKVLKMATQGGIRYVWFEISAHGKNGTVTVHKLPSKKKFQTQMESLEFDMQCVFDQTHGRVYRIEGEGSGMMRVSVKNRDGVPITVWGTIHITMTRSLESADGD